MKQYVVKVDVGYKHIEFTFSSIMGACQFMEMFIDHITDVEDGNETRVYMERIDLPEKESEDE